MTAEHYDAIKFRKITAIPFLQNFLEQPARGFELFFIFKSSASKTTQIFLELDFRTGNFGMDSENALMDDGLDLADDLGETVCETVDVSPAFKD